MKKEEAEKITEEFFKRRFPEKNIEFEKKCGYFWTWVERFQSENPAVFMDCKSYKVYEEIQKNLAKILT